MKKKGFRIFAMVRNADAGRAYCLSKGGPTAKDGDPLIVSRDEGKIALSTHLNVLFGNVSDAATCAVVVEHIDAGFLVMAQVAGPCFCSSRSVLIWSEGWEQEQEDSRKTSADDGMKVPEKA